jgi:hypothetical protein
MLAGAMGIYFDDPDARIICPDNQPYKPVKAMIWIRKRNNSFFRIIWMIFDLNIFPNTANLLSN